jgi:urea carboxylase-associated protein 2
VISVEKRREVADANRRRYEELRAAGQEAMPQPLPAATAIGAAPIQPDAIISHEEVAAGWYATIRLRRGDGLRIVDPSGLSSVSMIAWRAEDTSERINCADTVKVQWSAALSKGRIILSDMGRVVFSVIEDSCGAHDIMVGGSTPTTSGEGVRNTRENFIAGAAKIGLGLRDIPPCVTFFAPVSLDESGRLAWSQQRKRPGDFVDLRAEMNAILVLSNCSHPIDPAGPSASRPVSLIRHRVGLAAPDDPCRNGSAEARRAFEFTDRLYV